MRDVSWLLFKPIKKYLLKLGLSSADTFLHSLTITLHLASTGLSWQIPPFFLFCRDLWAWLSQLKACQTPQISTKTCSMGPGWNNLSAVSIFSLVTVLLLTSPFKLHSKLHLALQSIQTWHLTVAFPLKHSKILYRVNCTGFFFLGLTKTKHTYWQSLRTEKIYLLVTGSAWRCVVCMHISRLPHAFLLSCPSVKKVDILALRGPKAILHAFPFIL